MPVYTDYQQVALAIPDLGASTLSKNGVNITLSDFIQNALDTAGSVPGAIGYIFRQLASEMVRMSERLGDYSYSQQKDYFNQQAFYWEGLARAQGFVGAVPQIPQGIGLGVGFPYGTGWNGGN